MSIHSIEEEKGKLKDKKVVLRLDLDVPFKDGKVLETSRIERAKATIDFLVQEQAKIIIIAHAGRPKGKVVADLSLSFLPPVLKELWGHDVSFCGETIGSKAQKATADLKAGQILLLENLRFHAGEEENDSAFVKALGKLGDIYVCDAFASSHRSHASMMGLGLPNFAGLNLLKEVKSLTATVDNPQKPVAAIIGGAKVSTKLTIIKHLVTKMDMIILGGGMANTFFKAQGLNVGKSLCEPDMLDEVMAITALCQQNRCKLVLPVDGFMAKEFAANTDYRNADINDIQADEMMLDIGKKSVESITEALKDVKTVLWNGPMGAFEIEPFDHGTTALAQYVGEKAKTGDIVAVGGGGDTVSALAHAGVDQDFTYISTAGGAFLEWLEGKELPAIAALER
jgi:phosphoglycerate kinase